MPHKFVVRIDERLCEYARYEDIPDRIDQVIEFRPEIPPGPHTEKQHQEIESWIPRFERLMEIERARSSEKR